MYRLLVILPEFRAQQSIPDPNPIPQPMHSTLASSQSPSSPLLYKTQDGTCFLQNLQKLILSLIIYITVHVFMLGF